MFYGVRKPYPLYLTGTVKKQIGRSIKLRALFPKEARQRMVLSITMVYQVITSTDKEKLLKGPNVGNFCRSLKHYTSFLLHENYFETWETVNIRNISARILVFMKEKPIRREETKTANSIVVRLWFNCVF